MILPIFDNINTIIIFPTYDPLLVLEAPPSSQFLSIQFSSLIRQLPQFYYYSQYYFIWFILFQQPFIYSLSALYFLSPSLDQEIEQQIS